MSVPIAIRTAEASTSLGTLVTAAAAARAGIVRARKLDVGTPAGDAANDLEGAAAHRVAGVAPDASGEARLLAVADSGLCALTEAMASLRGTPGLTRLYLAVPKRGGVTGDRLAERGRAATDATSAVVFVGGRRATGEALAVAFDDLEKGTVRRAIVGACESKLDPEAIEVLAARGQLKTDAHPVGTIPGEASAWVVLERMDVEATGLRLARPTVGDESPRAPYAPTTGRVLASLLRGLDGGGPIGTLYADLNGEVHRATDLSMGMVRARSAHVDEAVLELPALAFGDVGAAFPLLALGLHLRALRRGYARGARAVVTVASDDGWRGVLDARAAAKGGLP